MIRHAKLFEILTGEVLNPEAQVQASVAAAALQHAQAFPSTVAEGRRRKALRADAHADLYASIGGVVAR